jgi:hypothetical protein
MVLDSCSDINQYGINIMITIYDRDNHTNNNYSNQRNSRYAMMRAAMMDVVVMCVDPTKPT